MENDADSQTQLPVYVAHPRALEDAIRFAIGECDHVRKWSSAVDEEDEANGQAGYILYGFGPSRLEAGDETANPLSLWFVVSKTFTNPQGSMRIEAVNTASDIDELPTRFTALHDRVQFTVWLTLGLREALQAAFHQRASA